MQIYEYIPYLLCVGIFLAIAVIGVCIYSIYVTNKHNKSVERLTEYNINVASNIDQSIPTLLEIIINDCFDDYKIKELLPLEDKYINSDGEKQIRDGLVVMVTSRISNATLDKLSLFYNLANIGSIIGDKIYIIVMNYVVEHNKNIMNKDSVK